MQHKSTEQSELIFIKNITDKCFSLLETVGVHLLFHHKKREKKNISLLLISGQFVVGLNGFNVA